MMLPLDQLRFFHAVARYGSFANAADKLAVTPSAVSQQIRRLEEICGVKLFDRVGRGVQLNSAGKILETYADRIDALASDAHRALDEARGLRAGWLRIVSSATAAAYYLPRLWVAFKQEHPGIYLQVAVDNSERVADRVIHFQDDIGVLSAQAKHPDLVLQLLAEDPLVVVVPSSHRWRGRSSVELADLAEEQLIVRELGSASRAFVERAMTVAGLKFRPAMEIASHEVIKQTIEMGYGIAIMSAAVVRREVEQGMLCQIKLVDSSFRRELYLAHHRDRASSPLISAMLALARTLQKPGPHDLPMSARGYPARSKRAQKG
jgi:DNA-binding transcriptional LysR family regulator